MSLLEDGFGLPTDGVLSLDCADELAMGRVTLEHVDQVDQVVEVSDAVRFTLPVKKAALLISCPIWPNPFTPTFTMCLRAKAGTAQEDMAVSETGRSREPLSHFCSLLTLQEGDFFFPDPLTSEISIFPVSACTWGFTISEQSRFQGGT